jgi:hypothetical protein
LLVAAPLMYLIARVAILGQSLNPGVVIGLALSLVGSAWRRQTSPGLGGIGEPPPS